MKTQGRFYIIHRPEVRLDVELFRDEPAPILWDFDGMFCIIPKAVLENAIDRKAMYDKSNKKVIVPQVYIYWDQGIPISNAAGRALLGE